MKPDKEIPTQDEIIYFDEIIIEWAGGALRQFPWRDTTQSTYVRIVSELLLQRTKAETVARFFDSFMNKYPDWQNLNESNVSALMDDLKPLGLYKRRSKVLKDLSLAISDRGGNIPYEREQIETLPGVGQYIANAIELIVYDRPKPLLDVNMARLLERYFGPRVLADIRHDRYLQKLAHSVVEESKDYLKVNFAILDYAVLVCKIRPRCEICALASECRYYSNCG